MNIFVRTETDDRISITIEANWTVGDLREELHSTHRAPILSYQGVELRDLKMPIADTGICSQSVVNVYEESGRMRLFRYST